MVDYSNIIRRSRQIVKNNKKLWIWGMILAAMSSGGFNFSSFSNIGRPNKNWQDLFQNKNTIPQELPQKINQVLGSTVSDPWKFISSFLSPIPISFWIILGLGILVAIIFGVTLRIFILNWATAGLMSQASLAEKGETISLEKGSIQGRNKWRKLFLSSLILWGGFTAASVFISLVSVLVLTLVPMVIKIVFLIILVPLIILFIAAFLFIIIWSTFCQIIISLEDFTLGKSLSFSKKVAKKFFAEGLLMGLINSGIGCLLGCGTILVIIIIGLIVAAVIFLIFATNQVAGISLGVFLGGLFLCSLALIVLVQGIIKAFMMTNWVLLYREIQKSEKFPDRANPPLEQMNSKV